MSKKLWGGRFSKPIDEDFDFFQRSIYYDYRLAEYDVYHSLIHIEALKEASILSNEEKEKLRDALKEILAEIKEGKYRFHPHSEDIHSDIQNKVEKKVGKLASKLHTLRSRNDQIVFDERCYCVKEAEKISHLIEEMVSSLKFIGEKFKSTLFVGYTHTRAAQVIYFQDYLSAYRCMFIRDRNRLLRFRENLPIYIGSGALTGSSLRKYYKKAIENFHKYEGKQDVISKIKVVKNPLDNVSERDFIVEFLSILSILQMHLSRLGEDFILYSTEEFGFIELPEDFCTGSSLMPHKKNPDFLELVRGYSGRVYGNLMSMLTIMKGLVLTYNRDMQIDKQPLFSSIDIIKEELKIMAKFIEKININEQAVNKALENESLYATELAEFLVYKGVPFAEAHRVIGKLIRYSQEKQIKIKEIPEAVLKSFHKELNSQDVKRIVTPDYVIRSRRMIEE